MARASVRYQKTYNGVRIDLTADNQNELDEKVRQKKNEIDAGLNAKNANATVKAYGDQWVELKKPPTVSEPVYAAYKCYLRDYIYPLIGNMRLRDVVHSHCLKIIADSADKSSSHRKQLRTTMSSLFRAAVKDHIISDNPASGIKIADVETSNRALTDAESAALLKICETYHAGLWLKFLYYTGVRQQETVPLKWGDIDKTNHTAAITKALKKTGNIGSTKSRRGHRVVIIPDPFWQEFIAHERGLDEYVFVTQPSIGAFGKGGKMFDHHAMMERWHTALKLMDVEMGRKKYRNKLIGEPCVDYSLKLHCLRHTYCTNNCRAGVPLKDTIDLMGHSSAKMVMDIYSHYDSSETEKARQIISSFYTQKGTNTGTAKADSKQTS